MNLNFKLTLAAIYISCLGVLLYFVFSNLEIKDLTDYTYIRNVTSDFLAYKSMNIILFTFSFILISIFWIFLLGFGSPIVIIAGFLYGKWLGTIICIITFSIGSSCLYLFAQMYFKNLIFNFLESKIKKFKDLFGKNEFLYFMLFRLAGGGGIPFPIQNILPVALNMKVKNYFFATLLGLAPSTFIICSLGSGLENLIKENKNITYLDIIYNQEIYLPIIAFILILVLAYFVNKKIFKK